MYDFEPVVSPSANAVLVKRAEEVLKNVSFTDYHFVVAEGHGGVYLRAWYMEKDVYNPEGAMEKQLTRKWLLHPEMTDSEIVQTAFKCCMTSYEHRSREHFLYKGHRVFGPHFDVEDLVKLCKDGRENAGGRR